MRYLKRHSVRYFRKVWYRACDILWPCGITPLLHKQYYGNYINFNHCEVNVRGKNSRTVNIPKFFSFFFFFPFFYFYFIFFSLFVCLCVWNNCIGWDQKKKNFELGGRAKFQEKSEGWCVATLLFCCRNIHHFMKGLQPCKAGKWTNDIRVY